MNSGPSPIGLEPIAPSMGNSERMNAGVPRRINRSLRTSMALPDFSLLSARIAKHSRQYSSIMFSGRNAFPLSVRQWTKSWFQTWSRRSGRNRTPEPTLSQSRPHWRCFIGTFSPSRRFAMMFAIGLRPMADAFRPVCRSPANQHLSAMQRSAPFGSSRRDALLGSGKSYQPDCRVSFIISATGRSSSGRPTGALRFVDRFCCRTRQARLSGARSWLRTRSMQARRRVGLGRAARSGLQTNHWMVCAMPFILCRLRQDQLVQRQIRYSLSLPFVVPPDKRCPGSYV